jgi:hypothetical protein
MITIIDGQLKNSYARVITPRYNPGCLKLVKKTTEYGVKKRVYEIAKPEMYIEEDKGKKVSLSLGERIEIVL